MRVAPSILSVSLVSIALAGCYASHEPGGPIIRPTPDGGTDGRVVMPPPPPPPPPGGTSAWLLSSITMREPSVDGRVPGANLDGLDSGFGSAEPDADCQEFNQDFTSLSDGFGGVDNGYSQLVPTLEGLLDPGTSLNTEIARAISEGRFLVLLELDGSPPISGQLFYGLPEGPLERDGSGGLLPGQRFRVLAPLGRGMGATTGGRTTLYMGDLTRAGAPIEPLVPLLAFDRLQRVELRFSFSATELSRGELGGAMTVEDGVELAELLTPGISDTVRSVLESVADIDPRPAEPAVCRALSFGVSFEAIPAVVVR